MNKEWIQTSSSIVFHSKQQSCGFVSSFLTFSLFLFVILVTLWELKPRPVSVRAEISGKVLSVFSGL